VHTGDVVVIPAGVAHRNLGTTGRVRLPAADPVVGKTGPLLSLWRVK
jgi:uncharacterized protein YjlB